MDHLQPFGNFILERAISVPRFGKKMKEKDGAKCEREIKASNISPPADGVMEPLAKLKASDRSDKETDGR